MWNVWNIGRNVKNHQYLLSTRGINMRQWKNNLWKAIHRTYRVPVGEVISKIDCLRANGFRISDSMPYIFHSTLNRKTHRGNVQEVKMWWEGYLESLSFTNRSKWLFSFESKCDAIWRELSPCVDLFFSVFPFFGAFIPFAYTWHIEQEPKV